MGRARPLTMAAVLLAAALVMFAPTSGAHAVDVLPEPLPAPVGMSTAAWSGDVAYIFGGQSDDSLLDTIVEFDPSTGLSRVLQWRLPSERKLSASVWTGDAALVIGGVGYDGDPLRDVVRFVPGEGVELRQDALPHGVKGVPAIWTGTHVYIFGNCLSATTGQFDILEYDPGTNTTEVLEGELPIPGAGSSAIWTGQEAYIFGGRLSEGFSDRIVRFVPGQGCELMEARLPSPRFGTSAVWDGQRGYVLGGSISLVCMPSECIPTEYTADIVVFDPVEDGTYAYWAWLPTARDTRAAALHQERIYVLGGTDADGPLSEVVEVDPYAPFAEEGDEPSLSVLLTILAIGILILVAVVVWSFRTWREPPMMSGGPLQG